MSTFGLNLRVTTDSKQGGRKYMEDMLSVKFQKSKDGKNIEYTYLAVFDGHGGVEAAKFAKEHLLSEITKQKGFWSDNDTLVTKAIRDGFISCHQLMWKNLGSWPKTVLGHPSTSGTTVSVVFIKNSKLYIAHVGDSSVVLGLHNSNNGMSAQCITEEHKPDAPKELDRIQESGGAVVAKAGVQRVVWNRPKKAHQGPIRRSTPIDRIPFLAIARALGDLWSYNSDKDVFVVSPEPDIFTQALDLKSHRCIILASDGLWNMLKPQEAVNIAQQLDEQSRDPYNGAKPASVLVRYALDKWAGRCLRADNTSVIVAYLDPPAGTSPSSSSPGSLTREPSTTSSSAATFKLGSDSEESLSDMDCSDEDLDLGYDTNDTSHLHMGSPTPAVVVNAFTKLMTPPVNKSPLAGQFQNHKGTGGNKSKVRPPALKLTPPRMTAGGKHKPSTPNSAPPKLHRVESTQVLEKKPRYSKQPSSPARILRSPHKSSDNSGIKPSQAVKGLQFGIKHKGKTIDSDNKVQTRSSPTKKSTHNSGTVQNSAASNHGHVFNVNQPHAKRQVGSNLTNGHPSPVRSRSLSVGSIDVLSANKNSNSEDNSPKQGVCAKSPLKIRTTEEIGQSPTSAMISPIWPRNLDADLGDNSSSTMTSSSSMTSTSSNITGHHSGSCELAGTTSSCTGVPAGLPEPEVLQENSTTAPMRRRGRRLARGFLRLLGGAQGSQNKAPAPLTRGGLKRKASTERPVIGPTTTTNSGAKKMKLLPKVSKLQSTVLNSARLKRRAHLHKS